MDVMLAQLRPDRPGPRDQHVVQAHPRRVPHLVAANCRTVLRAVDLDPRSVDDFAAPCVACVRATPREVLEVLMYVTSMSGQLHPAAEIGDTDRPEPVGVVYASGVAALGVRHIVAAPDTALRYPYLGRSTVLARCGHTAWCPVAGPEPSTKWPVCAECHDDVERPARLHAARPGLDP